MVELVLNSQGNSHEPHTHWLVTLQADDAIIWWTTLPPHPQDVAEACARAVVATLFTLGELDYELRFE